MAIFHLLPVLSVTRQLSNSSTKRNHEQRNGTSGNKKDNSLGCNDSFTWYSSIGMPTMSTD